jgi:putative oxidoreductase
VVRIVTGLLFMENGMAKLFGCPHVAVYGHPRSFSILGLAFILSGEIAVAYFVAQIPRSFFPLLNGGGAAVLDCFIFLYMPIAGGRAWSLDRPCGP